MPSVTFGPCQPCTGDALLARFSVSIEQDDDLEFDHSFDVEVASTTPDGVVLPPNGLVVVITDDGEFACVHGIGECTLSACRRVCSYMHVWGMGECTLSACCRVCSCTCMCGEWVNVHCLHVVELVATCMCG